MKASSAILLAVATASGGFIFGRLGMRPNVPAGAGASAAADVERVERERDEALVRASRAEAALQAERRRRAEIDVVTRLTEPGDAAPPVAPATPDPSAPPVPGAPASAAQRAADVRELTAAIAPALEREDGERALELLRRLASIVPEGRDAAMDLAVRLNEDVAGAGALHLDQYTFYTSLGDTGVRDLMLWALENPSPATFRVLSAASLPWIVPKERAIEALGAALATEKEGSVQQALVVGLAQMNDARAQKLLAATLADPTRDAELRAQVALSSTGAPSPEMTRALEAAAGGDASDKVRAAARAALAAHNPPVDGFLLTSVVADGAAAAGGLRAGDILLWYDGHATREVRDLREAIDAPGTSETAVVVVLREGQETTLQVRRGRLGVQGRPVKHK